MSWSNKTHLCDWSTQRNIFQLMQLQGESCPVAQWCGQYDLNHVKHLIVINTPPNCQCLPHPLQKSPLLENSPPILYLLPVKSPFPVWAQTGSRQLQAQKPKNQVLICKSRQTCTLKNTTNTPVPYQILLWTCAQSSDPQAHHAGYAPDVCWRAVITA